MRANIRTRDGLKEIEILKKPFEVKGICLFVHDNDVWFTIAEWQTGMSFATAREESEIRAEIIAKFKKVGEGMIKEVIQISIKKYGIANEGQGVKDDH